VNAIFENSLIEGTNIKERTPTSINPGGTVTSNSDSPFYISRWASFEEDLYVLYFPHNDALVVTAHIRCCKVSKILVDGEGSINILYGCPRSDGRYSQAGLKIDHPPNPVTSLRIRHGQGTFSGMVKFSVRADSFNVITEFSIMDISFAYNVILERLWGYT